jgi:thioesterase domain-containing protein
MLDDGGTLLADVESMACAYVDAVEAAGEPRPAVLAGWSMGGVVALEMARQLDQRHGWAPPVVAIDSVFGYAGEFTSEGLTEEVLLPGFVADLARSLGLPPPAETTGPVADRLAAVADDLVRAKVVNPGADGSWITARVRAYSANLRATATYQPKRYRGEVVLFLAAERTDHDHVVAQWRPVAGGGLRVAVTPGDHYSIIGTGNLDLLLRAWPRSSRSGPAPSGGSLGAC